MIFKKNLTYKENEFSYIKKFDSDIRLYGLPLASCEIMDLNFVVSSFITVTIVDFRLRTISRIEPNSAVLSFTKNHFFHTVPGFTKLEYNTKTSRGENFYF